MIKKLLAVALVIAMLSTSVFAAESATEYEEATYCVEEPAEIELFDSDGTSVSVGGMVAIAQVMPFGMWDGHDFDDTLDLLFFLAFRDGFEVIRRQSVDINQIVTYGNWEMEILAAVAIGGQVSTFPDWAGQDWFAFDDETGELFIYEYAEDGTRERHLMEDPEKLLEMFEARMDEGLIEMLNSRNVEVRTFFTLRDTSGEFPVNWGTMINFTQDPYITHGNIFGGHANFFHYDDETGKAYFVGNHWGSVEEGDSIIVNFAIERILSDNRTVNEEIAINLAELLENHEATFITEESRWRLGGNSTMEMFEILGEDFDPQSPDREFMERGEINVHIFEDIYLTNIAVRDNLLYLQISQPRETPQHSSERWTSISLINPTVEIPILEFDENTNWDEIDESFWQAQTEMFRQRYILNLFSVDVTKWEITEEGLPVQQIPETRVTEMAFHLEDMSVLGDLVFNISVSYFGVNEGVNLNVEEFELPIIGQILEFEDIEVTIDGDTYLIYNIQVSFTELRFNIGGEGRIFDMVGHGFMQEHPSDLFEIFLILTDGTEVDFTAVSFGTGMGWSTDMDTGLVSNLSLSFSRSVIDVDNLEALSINGVVVSQK